MRRARRFVANRAAVAGAIGVAVLGVLAVLAPLVIAADPRLRER